MNNDKEIREKLNEFRELIKNNQDGSIKSILLYADLDTYNFISEGVLMKDILGDFDYFTKLLRKQLNIENKILILKDCFKYWYNLNKIEGK